MPRIQQIPRRAPADQNTELWQRVHELIALTEINGLIAPTPARIATQGEDFSAVAFPGGAWTPLNVGAIVSAVPAINMRLGTGAEANRLIYTGTVPNNVAFHAGIFTQFSPATSTEIGWRKNGDDGTVIEIRLSVGRTEFASALQMAYDMNQDDYVELVIRFGGSPTVTAQNVMLYAQHTGFRPNA